MADTGKKRMLIKEEKLQRRASKAEREKGYFVFGLVEDGGEHHMLKIDPRLDSPQRLETVIHEALHHLNVEWSEEKVDRQAKQLKRILWGDNWRRVSK